MIPFAAHSVRRALNAYIAHYHTERNHHGPGNCLFDPAHAEGSPTNRFSIGYKITRRSELAEDNQAHSIGREQWLIYSAPCFSWG